MENLESIPVRAAKSCSRQAIAGHCPACSRIRTDARVRHEKNRGSMPQNSIRRPNWTGRRMVIPEAGWARKDGNKMKNRIGFVGLGQMGKWMAINLLRAGFDLTVFDIDHQALTLLQTKGAGVADSPAKLSAQTELLILCLPNPEVIDTVIWGKDGAVEGLSSGQLIIDCGTSDYRWTAEFAAKLSEKGIRFVDAPVTGNGRQSQKGYSNDNVRRS